MLVATLLFAFLASIAVARFHFKGRRAFIVSVLIVQMIPGEAMMFTIYGMIDDWRLINTLLGLGIVYLASVIPFTIWTLRGFVAGVPADLEEAAMIDGCTKSQAFWKVTFPLLAPGLVATGIFAFIQSWNEFTMALLLMKGYNLTLPTWLNAFQSSSVVGLGQLGRRHGRLHPDRDPGGHLLPDRPGSHDRRSRRRGGQGLMRAVHRRRLPQGGRPMRVGLDIGGTKTDAVAVDSAGHDRRARAPRHRLGTRMPSCGRSWRRCARSAPSRVDVPRSIRSASASRGRSSRARRAWCTR